MNRPAPDSRSAGHACWRAGTGSSAAARRSSPSARPGTRRPARRAGRRRSATTHVEPPEPLERRGDRGGVRLGDRSGRPRTAIPGPVRVGAQVDREHVACRRCSSRAAIARPIPLAAPVTSAARPRSRHLALARASDRRRATRGRPRTPRRPRAARCAGGRSAAGRRRSRRAPRCLGLVARGEHARPARTAHPRTPSALGDRLEHLLGRRPQAALDLRQVRVGDPGQLGELAHRHLGQLTLLADDLAEAAGGLGSAIAPEDTRVYMSCPPLTSHTAPVMNDE